MEEVTLKQVEPGKSFFLGGYEFIKHAVPTNDELILCEIPKTARYVYIADHTIVKVY